MTISDEDFYVTDETPHDFGEGPVTWWEASPYMIQVPYQSWVELKSYIIKQCKQHGGCAAHVGTWERKIQTIDEKTIRD